MILSQILKSRRSSPSKNYKNWQRFCQKAWFKDIKFPVKIRGIHRIEEKNSISISVFGYENKEKHPISVSKKCCEEKHVDLLVTGEEGKRHYVIIKDFNTFMYDHSLHCGKNLFAVIVYKISVQKEYQNVILKTALKLMANKEL